MTASSRPPSRLTPFQSALLHAFFANDRELFLTGGAALAGFWLGHRTTDDLELFGLPGADLERAVRTLEAVAADAGATSVVMQSYPDFRRLHVDRGEERCKVDLAVDRAPPLESMKVEIDGIRLDSPREIAANKICTLLSRAEIRDLVDLRALLELGCDLEAALRDAATKDRGADAATLGWILDQLAIGPDARLPGEVDPLDLETFRGTLVKRLRALAAAQTR